jgi:membrane protease YdiL (CAAX protease family)
MLSAVWQRCPVIGRAVLAGVALATIGTTPWALLASSNLKHGSAVPWAVPPTALYLWLFWRYARGDGWPASTSQARRANLRELRLSDDMWAASLVAGGLGLVTLVLLFAVVNRLVRLPQQQSPDLSQIPLVTVASLVLMSAAVAGIVEEVSFRGYMQRPIERRHGPVVAILVTGLVFGFMHFTHPEVTLLLIPYYLTVAAIYGGLAYLTNSILPGLLLHAGGNVLAFIDLVARGRGEWQASASPAPLVWEAGPDASFWFSCVAVLVAAAATVWAYSALARVSARPQGEGAARRG